MARWENEDISSLNLPDPVSVQRSFFDKNGNEINDEESAFAKTSSTNDSQSYYIKYARGEIIDPHHIDTNMKRTTYPKTFKKVDKKAFDAYLKFLQTKNRLYFTIARRITMERI